VRKGEPPISTQKGGRENGSFGRRGGGSKVLAHANEKKNHIEKGKKKTRQTWIRLGKSRKKQKPRKQKQG